MSEIAKDGMDSVDIFPDKTMHDSAPIPERILMLVPHDPDLDPRIGWVAGLCSQIGRTDVIGVVSTTSKPKCKYDGNIYLERVYLERVLSFSHFKNLVYRILIKSHLGKCLAYHYKKAVVSISNFRDLVYQNYMRFNPGEHHSPEVGLLHVEHNKSGLLARHINSCRHFNNFWKDYFIIVDTLYKRARAISIYPKVMICHDIYALGAAVKLKQLFNCPIIYDSHELWPAADLQASTWQRKIVEVVERKLIRQADTVITVTPQIARHLEVLYGIKHVLSVPNAEPLVKTNVCEKKRTVTLPLRFLVQGNVSIGRGFDELLSCWGQVTDNRAVLVLRCPANQYYQELQEKYASLIREGRVIIAEPVKESQLIDAASAADVGVIPYGGPSLNHIYACPNKLSQYMQAGLAILHNSDQEYVTHIVQHYRCGVSYSPSEPSAFREVVQHLVDNPQELATLRQNAFHAAKTEFNWQIQSKAYFEEIKHFYENGSEWM